MKVELTNFPKMTKITKATENLKFYRDVLAIFGTKFVRKYVAENTTENTVYAYNIYLYRCRVDLTLITTRIASPKSPETVQNLLKSAMRMNKCSLEDPESKPSKHSGSYGEDERA